MKFGMIFTKYTLNGCNKNQKSGSRQGYWDFFKLYLITLKFKTMLRWTVIFLVVAIIAAIFGFTGIAAGAAAIAKILFYIFIVLFLLSLIAGGFRRVD